MSILLQTIPQWLMTVLFYLLLRRRAYKICPFFFAYVAFGVGADITRLLARNHPHPFYAAYWITETGYDLLGILVMYELVGVVLRNLVPTWWGRLIFPSILVAGASLSLARAYNHPPQFEGRLAFCIVTGEVAVRFVQALATPLTIIPLFGLRGHRYPLGVAAGFGVYSMVALMSTIKLSDTGTSFVFLWGITMLVAYSVAELIWIWSFATPQGQELQAPL